MSGIVSTDKVTTTFSPDFGSGPRMQAIITEAKSVAGSVSDAVLALIGTMSGDGATRLADAVSAIDALAGLDFNAPNIQFTAPVVGDFSPVDVPAGEFTAPTSSFVMPDISFGMTMNPASPPAIPNIALPAGGTIRQSPGGATPPPVGGTPTPYVAALPVAESAPGVNVGEFLSTINPVAPVLEIVTIPEFALPALPDYAPPAAATAPSVPLAYATPITPSPYAKLIPELDATLMRMLTEHGLYTLTDAARGHEMRSGELSIAASDFVNRFVNSRGLDVTDDMLSSAVDYATDQAALQHGAVGNSNIVALAEWREEALDLAVQLGASYEAFLMDNYLAYGKLQFDAEVAYAESALEISKAITALYNAKIMDYNASVAEFRAEIDRDLLGLTEFEAKVDVAKVTAGLNKQLARQYTIMADAEGSVADEFDARVSVIKAKVAAYKASTKEAQMNADLAKATASSYGAEVEAYRALLSGYKAEFDKYEGESRRVAAVNAAKVAAMRAQGVGNELLAAEASMSVARIESQAATLRATAVQNAADYEAIGVGNSLAALQASISEAQYSAEAKTWAAERTATAATARAHGDYASALSRYFSQASDAAYRAAEATLRAETTAASAVVNALESAGRAAASTVQGAYSAVRVGASVGSQGSVSGQEQGRISDDTSYTFSHQSTDSHKIG